MNISEYLAKEKLSQAAFAALVDVTQGRVSQWLKGETIPVERALAIEAATKHAVTRYDLRPDVFGPAPAGKAAA